MKFSEGTSYNGNTKVRKVGGRFVVEPDTQERAQIIMLGILTYRNGVTVRDLLAKINSAAKHKYSANDVRTSVARLVANEYATRRNGKIYTTAKLVKQFGNL